MREFFLCCFIFSSDKQDLTQWNLTEGDADSTDNLTIEKICLEFSPMRRRNAFYKINKNVLRHQRLQTIHHRGFCDAPHFALNTPTALIMCVIVVF